MSEAVRPSSLSSLSCFFPGRLLRYGGDACSSLRETWDGHETFYVAHYLVFLFLPGCLLCWFVLYYMLFFDMSVCDLI